MDKFIQLLQEFENDTSLEYDYDEFIANTHIGEVASRLLIDKDGRCNWENINTLKEKGFSAVPLEKDRFGWLIGGIVTKKGIITYG
jgi:hypothetical protein